MRGHENSHQRWKRIETTCCFGEKVRKHLSEVKAFQCCKTSVNKVEIGEKASVGC